MAADPIGERDDDLEDWLAALRDRLEHGDLDDVAPVDLGYGTHVLPAALTIRIMLADLDGCDDPATPPGGRRRDIARRASLFDDFRRLRELLG